VDEKFDAKLFGSNFVIFEIPDWPSIIFFQESLTPIPTGVTKPSPVTTTLLLFMSEPKLDLYWAPRLIYLRLVFM